MPTNPRTTDPTRARGAHVALAAAAAIGATVVAAAPVLAHPGHDVSVTAGLAHPFLGLDHVLAMCTVGALGVVQRRRLTLPVAFVAAMALGGLLAVAGVPMPGAEVAVAASVVALGLALLAARHARPELTVAAVSLAGIAHGHVHGTEAAGAPAAGFLAAVLVSTVVLHAIGMLGGVAVSERHTLRRTLAVLVMGAGAGLVVAAIGA